MMKWITTELANKRADFPHKNIPESNKEIFCKVNGANETGRILPFYSNDKIIDYHFFKPNDSHGYALSNMKSFIWLDESASNGGKEDDRNVYKEMYEELVDENQELQQQIAVMKMDATLGTTHLRKSPSPVPTSLSAEEILRQNIPTITFGKLIGTPIEQVIKVMDLYASSRDDTIDRLEGLVARMYNEFIRSVEDTSPAVSEDNWRKFQKENKLLSQQKDI